MYSPTDRLFIKTRTYCKECKNLTTIVKVDANRSYKLFISFLLAAVIIQILGLVTLYICK